MELGVNFIEPRTPNLDRVVEMSTLLEGLRLAFSDLDISEYPWPGQSVLGGGFGEIQELLSCQVSQGDLSIAEEFPLPEIPARGWSATPRPVRAVSGAEDAIAEIRKVRVWQCQKPHLAVPKMHWAVLKICVWNGTDG